MNFPLFPSNIHRFSNSVDLPNTTNKYIIFKNNTMKNDESMFKVKTTHLENNVEVFVQYKNGLYCWKYLKSDVETFGVFEQCINESGCFEMYVFLPNNLLNIIL